MACAAVLAQALRRRDVPAILARRDGVGQGSERHYQAWTERDIPIGVLERQ